MKPIQVAVGILKNAHSQYLVAKRPAGKPYAGYWEFPGGKVEPQEDVRQGLIREFQEEVNITPVIFQPLIQVEQDTGEKIFLLEAWLITEFQGIVHPNEQQELAWANLKELQQLLFPPANTQIIARLIAVEST